MSSILTEYDEELHIKNEKEISREEGMQEGIERGISKGEVLFARLAEQLLARGKEEDLKKALSDSDYRKTLYQIYGIS